VASFCTRCGAAITNETQFCTACGAPAGAAGAGPVVVPYAPAAVPAPGPGGSSAVKIILIIVAVFVGLGILGASIFAFTIWRVSRAIHVEGNGDKVTLRTPGGVFSANSSTVYTAGDLGVDIYPGATNGHGSTKIDTPKGSIVTGVFLTGDSKDQVVSFYKSKLGSGASVYDTQNGAIMTLAKANQESVMVTINANTSQYGGKTQFAIMHSRNTKPS
jgi:hypothetical protein